MTILESIEKDYSRISEAAGKFLHRLTCNNIQKDIMLSAELSGLKLLRANSAVDLSKIEPGVILLGAVPDEFYDLMEKFIMGWAVTNELEISDLHTQKLPADALKYLPEVSQYEGPFNEICEENKIELEYHPYVAACSALKLVAAGKQLNLLDPRAGLAMTMYHIIAASKTVPYPENESRGNEPTA